MDAACGVAALLREVCEAVEVYSFSNNLARAPSRRGSARDAIVFSRPHGGTYLGKALEGRVAAYDRILVITDEQAHDCVPSPRGRGHVVNVASASNGVGYGSVRGVSDDLRPPNCRRRKRHRLIRQNWNLRRRASRRPLLRWLRRLHHRAHHRRAHHRR
jgi:hypothetical protein